MKVLKPGFYILGETLWVVLPTNERFFLWKYRQWMWEKSYSTVLERSRSKFIGNLNYE